MGVKQIHYSWVICLTGIVVLFSCLGLGRFSLGVLLPSMSSSLQLNYSQMGLIGTGNFIGYILSVLAAGRTVDLLGARKTITMGLVLVGSSMMAISWASTFIAAFALYFVTGIGSGLANVPLMGLVSHWFTSETRGRAAGIMISGNGMAIIFSGLFIPWIVMTCGSEGWRTGWLTIGAISLVVSLIAGLLLRNRPSEVGLAPLGKPPPEQSCQAEVNDCNPSDARRTMIHLGVIYLLFGVTYVVYVTFIVTAMVNERNFGEGAAGRFWAIVGALSLFSGPLFGWLSDKFSRKTAIIGAFASYTVAYAFAAIYLSDYFLYASIVIFGLVVWSIPTIMSAAVGDYMGPEQAVKAFGFITLFFGAGQIAGPALAGWLADVSGNFNMGFWLCSLLTACAGAIAYFLKKPE
ncbi:MFS transporter [Desulfatibacillum aliphaticivorans]|uniref:MFS transporter n=1 Tax=Desulfatibacillum aliphaticivorans TaxID=218208 RepID=UPI0004834BF4|nr:MFS transporter [Desulfatibacillum aliphaticivorans]